MDNKSAKNKQQTKTGVVEDYLDSMLRAVTEEMPEQELEKPQTATQGEQHRPMTQAQPEHKRPAPEEVQKVQVAQEEPKIQVAQEELSALFSRELSRQTLPQSITPPPMDTALKTPEAAPDKATTFEVEEDSLADGEWLENGRPPWAQEEFDCLLFGVADMKLAVPLIELGGIVKIEQDLNKIFGQPDWYLGLLRWNNRNIRVVDTYQLLTRQQRPDSEQSPYHYVLLIHGTEWGIGLNTLSNSVRIKPDEIRWRAKRESNPWHAGTLVEHMSSLIDINAFAHRLYDNHKNQKT